MCSVLRLDSDGCVQVMLTSSPSARHTAPFSLVNTTASSSPPLPDAPPTTPASSASHLYHPGAQKGFLDGVFGCLRPVLSFIGKATAAELKHQGRSTLHGNSSYLNDRRKLTCTYDICILCVSLRDCGKRRSGAYIEQGGCHGSY